MRTDSISPAFPFALMGALLTGGMAAQQPTDPRPAATPDVLLLPLQSLANETVHHRQPTAAGPTPQGGPAAFVPFAKVRDAKFTVDGRLVTLLVEPAATGTGEVPTRRELPARQVQWDTLNKRWITTDPNLKFAELAEAGKPSPMPSVETAPPKDRLLLASELVQSTIVTDRSAPPQPGKDEKSPPNAPVPVFWLAPSQQLLVFAVIEHDKHHVPLPWSVLRLTDSYGRLAFTVDGDASRLKDAPHGEPTNEQPPAELRQRIYRHFGIAPPAWETPAPAETPKPKTTESGETPRR